MELEKLLVVTDAHFENLVKLTKGAADACAGQVVRESEEEGVSA